MPTPFRSARLLGVLTLAAGLTAGAAPIPSRAASAGAIGVAPALLSAQTAITSTAGTPNTITAGSGVTVVRVPYQVTSGSRLSVAIHTQPGAHVSVTLSFPDGTAVTMRHPANGSGDLRFAPYIAYQPQGSADTATLLVRAIDRKAGLDDTVTGSVQVLPHIALSGYLRLPRAVWPGQKLTVTVGSNLPNVSLRLRLIYPDQQVEPVSGVTDSAGTWTQQLAVSTSDGTHGYLRVEAVLSYGGVERRYYGRVALRAVPRRVGHK